MKVQILLRDGMSGGALGGEQGAVWVNAPGDLLQDFLLAGRDGLVSAWLLPMAGKWLRAMQG